MSTRQTQLINLLRPVVESLEYELWGLEYIASGRHATLRIYIDRPEVGVLLEDCERVSRQVSAVLDVEDPIQNNYTLEVSSPGMDRPLYTLEQFAQFAGEEISARLRHPYEGRRRFRGRLQGGEGQDIVLVVGDEEYLFPIELIEKANVIPDFSGADEADK